MIIVLDTNVLYQALRGRSGASFYILQLIRNQKIQLALSLQVFSEYQDVLKRPKSLEDLKLKTNQVDAALRLVAYIGKSFVPYFLFRPNLKDENDNIFIEVAVASDADYLITSNIKDFTFGNDLKFDERKIITPADFVRKWKETHEE